MSKDQSEKPAPLHIFEKIRAKKEWRQEDLAEELGISREMISKIERGECGLSYQTAESLLKIIKRKRLYPRATLNMLDSRYK